MRNRLNFNYLECFLKVAETLSFSRAAKELKIAQPAVSKQIKSLEEHLQVQLFIRDKKQVLLSKQGKDFHERVASPYNEICSGVDSFLLDDEELKGRITVGCLQQVGEIVFVPLLSNFKKEHNGIKFDIQLIKNIDIIAGVKSGRIDIGIISEEVIQENIRAYKILKEEIILVTNSKNREKDISKITELPFISYRDNSPLLNHYISKLSPKLRRNRLNVEVMVNSHRSMIDLITKHPYYAVLPKLSVEKQLEDGSLYQVDAGMLSTDLYLIYRDVDYLDKKVRALKDYLLKERESL